MSAGKDRPQGKRTVDELLRQGLNELYGKAEAPDRVWVQIRQQVQAGPSLPRRGSRKTAWWGRVATQFVALTSVLLFVFTFRAEMVRQGDADILTWRRWQPVRSIYPAGAEPLILDAEDTLSGHDQFQFSRTFQMLPAGPARQARPVPPEPVVVKETVEMVDAPLLGPQQDLAALHPRGRRWAKAEEALAPSSLPVNGSRLTRLSH
ncbi:MAG: hypothetical protein ACUVXG_03680 [Anaerolineae bacterium]